MPRMELPFRPQGDILLTPGDLPSVRKRLAAIAGGKGLSAVIACAFDHRTRMLPFIVADTHMVPAGVRAVASAFYESGIENVRIVLQQWNKRFDPAQMKLDGRIPDIFCLSSMSLHTAEARKLLQRVRMIPAEQRPLVIAGGSVCVYEPWELFDTPDDYTFGPDVCITGETFPLLSMLEIILASKGESETVRQAFLRCKKEALFDAQPGIMYPVGDDEGPPERLIDTGMQHMCGNLDEMAHPIHAFSMLEPPSRGRTLSSTPIEASRVKRHTPLVSMAWTFGCKFRCEYCPIPAYNQRQYRTKTPERMIEEITAITTKYGIRNYFGADDNFFNDHDRTLEWVEKLNAATIDGKRFGKVARLMTEATVHDVFTMKKHLRSIRTAGFRALWLGVEDMSGALVKKGQTTDQTCQAFELLIKNRITPNPMMMHHDDQPLISRGNSSGLLNQVRMLAKSGALTLQVLMLTPSAGSKLYEGTFESGMVIDRVGGKKLEAYMYDGNHVIASNARHPWKKQINLLLAYMLFYNPVRLAVNSVYWHRRRLPTHAIAQIWGMYGLTQNIRRTVGWMFRLMLGHIVKRSQAPVSGYPVVTPDGEKAPHVNGQPDEAHRV